MPIYNHGLPIRIVGSGVDPSLEAEVAEANVSLSADIHRLDTLVNGYERYTYGGVELPSLPEYDRAAYHYAVLAYVQSDTVFFRCDSVAITVDENGNCDMPMEEGKTYKLEDGQWKGEVASYVNSIFWANHDVLYDDGTVYLAASDPVPVETTAPERTLTENAEALTVAVDDTIEAFDRIKTAITDAGVTVSDGVAANEYPAMVGEVYTAGETAGVQDVVDEVDPLIVAENEKLRARLDGDTGESGDIYDKVYNDGVEAGKQSEYDAFWDAAQLEPIYGGLRGQSACLFAGFAWNATTFRPKYDIYPTNANMMFSNGSCLNLDIAEILEKQGVRLDLTRCTSATNFLQYSSCIRLPELDLRNMNSVNNIISHATVKTIDKYILRDDGSQTVTNSIVGCKKLTHVIVEGCIGANGFNISASPLDKESLTSIVNALSATTTGLTVTLRLDAVNKAFETSEGAMDGSTSDEWLALAATKSNWTISLINS